MDADARQRVKDMIAANRQKVHEQLEKEGKKPGMGMFPQSKKTVVEGPPPKRS